MSNVEATAPGVHAIADPSTAPSLTWMGILRLGFVSLAVRVRISGCGSVSSNWSRRGGKSELVSLLRPGLDAAVQYLHTFPRMWVDQSEPLFPLPSLVMPNRMCTFGARRRCRTALVLSRSGADDVL